MEDRLQDFIHFMIVEKGLAQNTIISYERDLKHYLQYIQKVEQIGSLNDISRIQIIHFLALLKDEGKSAKTRCTAYRFDSRLPSVFAEGK